MLWGGGGSINHSRTDAIVSRLPHIRSPVRLSVSMSLYLPSRNTGLTHIYVIILGVENTTDKTNYMYMYIMLTVVDTAVGTVDVSSVVEGL